MSFCKHFVRSYYADMLHDCLAVLAYFGVPPEYDKSYGIKDLCFFYFCEQCTFHSISLKMKLLRAPRNRTRAKLPQMPRMPFRTVGTT